MTKTKEESVLTINLVEAIEKHPCLYNFKIPEYARKNITEKAWSKVAEEVKETVIFCKEKWKNLRTVFVRNMKPAPSGSSRKTKKPYYLNEYLQFLLPFIKPNTDLITSRNLPSPISEHGVLFKNNEQSETGDQYEDLVKREKYLSDKITSIESPSHERSRIPVLQEHNQAKGTNKKRKYDVSQIDQSFIDLVNIKKKMCKEDPRKMFLLSLLPDINTMTDKQMRMFKKKVLDVVDDILTENLTLKNQIPITISIPSHPHTTSSTTGSSIYSCNYSNNSFTPIQSPLQESSQMCNQDEHLLDNLLNM